MPEESSRETRSQIQENIRASLQRMREQLAADSEQRAEEIEGRFRGPNPAAVVYDEAPLLGEWEIRDNQVASDLTDSQRELLEQLQSMDLTATGRNLDGRPLVGGVLGGTGRTQAQRDGESTPEPQNDYVAYRDGGRIRHLSSNTDAVPLHAFTSGNSWFTLNQAQSIDVETTGGPMPRTAEVTGYVPLVQRLENQLDARRRELRTQVSSALSQADSIAANLREMKELLNRTSMTTRDLDECKYLARHSREYLSTVSRAVNPYPAAFTNLIRISKDITQERTRIEEERAVATLEDRQERFREAVEADEGYVPSPLDFVQVDRISQWPLHVVSVSPAVANPESLAEATVVLEARARSGQHYTRSLGWLRDHGMTQTTQDARPARNETPDTGEYMPQVGDSVEINGDICTHGYDPVRQFRVLNVNMDTTATDNRGNPNPYVRLSDLNREDLTWTRRLSTLRGAGLRRLVDNDRPLREGDRFAINGAELHIDWMYGNATIFRVTEVDTRGGVLDGSDAEVWFIAEGGSGYRYVRSERDLRSFGIRRIQDASDVPAVGDRLQFNNSDAVTYQVTEIEVNELDADSTRVRFYAVSEVPVGSTRTPFEYCYTMAELRSIDMVRVFR